MGASLLALAKSIYYWQTDLKLDSLSFLTLVTKQQSHLAFDQAALSYFSFSFLFFLQFSFFLPFLIPSICFG